jgi:5-formyltetrahydrofolate cyclo-ligase
MPYMSGKLTMSGKRVLREELLADRAALPAPARAGFDRALIAAAVALTGGHRRVAGYVPMPGEPGGSALVDALADAVPELLLPVLRPDFDLDWAVHDGSFAPGHRPRLSEPVGPRLGVEAVATASLVLVPALAVDGSGSRLGRGGGSYDRALARVPAEVPVVALLYPDEILPALPHEPHDRPVTGALTPAGLVQLPLQLPRNKTQITPR